MTNKLVAVPRRPGKATMNGHVFIIERLIVRRRADQIRDALLSFARAGDELHFEAMQLRSADGRLRIVGIVIHDERDLYRIAGLQCREIDWPMFDVPYPPRVIAEVQSRRRLP